MGLAIDTIVGHAVNPGAAVTGVTMAAGDSASIRSFNPPASAKIERIVRAGGTAGLVQVRSPLMHDMTRGIRFTSSEDPLVVALPLETGQLVNSQDTLTIELTGGAAETDLAILSLYYQNLQGGSARLHSWGDIAGLIVNIKPVEVDCVASAAIGTWTDTALNVTENLLKANTDYAVLGYVTDVEVAYVAVKGQDTSNLRIGGPGKVDSDETSDLFVFWGNREGTPHIPVINAANAGSTFVSVVDDEASTAVKVQLVLAQLSQNLPN